MDLLDKCLSGYWYEFGSNMNIKTGNGGAKEFIKMMREVGFPDTYIGNIVFVHTELGKRSLNELNVVSESKFDNDKKEN